MRKFIILALGAAAISTGALAQKDPASDNADAEARQDVVVVSAARRDVPVEALPNTIRLID